MTKNEMDIVDVILTIFLDNLEEELNHNFDSENVEFVMEIGEKIAKEIYSDCKKKYQVNN